MQWTAFNANDYVRVKLTNYGREVHRKSHALLLEHLIPSAAEAFPYQPPVEDEDGWSQWQFWSLMNTFGPHMWMTRENCFEMDIQFKTN